MKVNDLNLKVIAKLICELDEGLIDSSEDPPRNNEFIEISKKDTPPEIVIRANKEGLITLAATFLRLAEKAVVNSHFHFDETVVDACDVPLVVVYAEPEPVVLPKNPK